MNGNIKKLFKQIVMLFYVVFFSKFYFYLLVTCRPDTARFTYWRVKLSADCHLMNQENFLLLKCHL